MHLRAGARLPTLPPVRNYLRQLSQSSLAEDVILVLCVSTVEHQSTGGDGQ